MHKIFALVILALAVGMASAADKCTGKSNQECLASNNCIFSGTTCKTDPCVQYTTEDKCPPKECIYLVAPGGNGCKSVDLMCGTFITQQKCGNAKFCRWENSRCVSDKKNECQASSKTAESECKTFPAVAVAAVVILLLGVVFADVFMGLILIRKRQQSISTVKQEAVTVDNVQSDFHVAAKTDDKPAAYAPPVAAPEPENDL